MIDDKRRLTMMEINKKVIICIYSDFEESLDRIKEFLNSLKSQKHISGFALFPDFENEFLVWDVYFEGGGSSTGSYSLRDNESFNNFGRNSKKMSSYYIYVKKAYLGKNILKKILNFLKRPTRLEVSWKESIEKDLDEKFGVNFDEEISKILGKQVMEGIRELQKESQI